MKRKQTILLVAIFLCGPTACYLFQSCPEVAPYFSIESINVNNYGFNFSYFNPTDTLAANATIDWDRYYLSVSLEADFYYAACTFSGGSNLMALSCAEPGYLGTREGIDTLYVVTLQDYNNRFSRQDTINTILMVNATPFSQNNPQDYGTLAAYIAENQANITRQLFTLRLTEPPATNLDTQQFNIIYQLTNGTVFTETSPPVVLRN